MSRESSSLTGGHVEVPPFREPSSLSGAHFETPPLREPPSLSGTHLETPPLVPGLPIYHTAGASSGVDLEVLGHRVGGGWVVGRGASSGHGLSSAALEDLEEVERACLQRASALKDEEQFVETLGREDNPIPL